MDEPDLRDLIRSFGASEFNKAARSYGVLELVAEKSKVGPMFAWFQRLLPKTGGFFELFEAHAVALMAAADATGRLLQGGPTCTKMRAKFTSANMMPTRSSAKY